MRAAVLAIALVLFSAGISAKEFSLNNYRNNPEPIQKISNSTLPCHILTLQGCSTNNLCLWDSTINACAQNNSIELQLSNELEEQILSGNENVKVNEQDYFNRVFNVSDWLSESPDHIKGMNSTLETIQSFNTSEAVYNYSTNTSEVNQVVYSQAALDSVTNSSHLIETSLSGEGELIGLVNQLDYQFGTVTYSNNSTAFDRENDNQNGENPLLSNNTYANSLNYVQQFDNLVDTQTLGQNTDIVINNVSDASLTNTTIYNSVDVDSLFFTQLKNVQGLFNSNEFGTSYNTTQITQSSSTQQLPNNATHVKITAVFNSTYHSPHKEAPSSDMFSYQNVNDAPIAKSYSFIKEKLQEKYHKNAI